MTTASISRSTTSTRFLFPDFKARDLKPLTSVSPEGTLAGAYNVRGHHLDIDSDDNDIMRMPDSGTLIRGTGIDDTKGGHGEASTGHLYQNAGEAQNSQQFQKKFATVGVPMTTFKPYRNGGQQTVVS